MEHATQESAIGQASTPSLETTENTTAPTAVTPPPRPNTTIPLQPSYQTPFQRQAEPLRLHTKRKKPGLAAFLSIIPGLGQIYNGQIWKGILYFILIIQGKQENL